MQRGDLFKKIDDLRDEVAALGGDVKRLHVEKAAVKEAARLSDERDGLKREIVDLKIEKSHETESHEREKREVEHMVGLERRRQEFEIDQAKRETTVQVREENLTADKARFEEQMKFHNERFAAEVGYLKEIMGEILERLPTVTVERTIEESGGSSKRRSA